MVVEVADFISRSLRQVEMRVEPRRIARLCIGRVAITPVFTERRICKAEIDRATCRARDYIIALSQ
jgi:hypothetical protein